MGLLDDAIREHLDLKRRRGADPTEIERAEREALGPVRRGPDAPEQVEPGAGEVLAYDHEGEEDWSEPFAEEMNGVGTHDAPEPERFIRPEPVDADEPPRPAESPVPAGQHDPEEPFGSEDPFADVDAPSTPAPHPAPASPPPPRASEHAGQETVEYEVEAALQEEGEKSEDVLEETPEFLQDTPDHDRLWFEQRPPRDFDFEG